MNNPFVPEKAAQSYKNNSATIEEITAGGLVIRTADGTLHEKPCKRLASYSPTVGDRVYIVPFGKNSTTYLVVGKVV